VKITLGFRLASYLKKPWLCALLLVLAGTMCRAPSLQGQLVWDDQYLVRDSPLIQSPIFVLEVFRHHLFPDSFAAHYRPVQNLSFIADYLLWDSEVYGYHLSNLLFHVVSGVLLYLLLRHLFVSLGGNRPSSGERSRLGNPNAGNCAAFSVALLWIVHPVHSAAIDYISGRADSLAFLFACGGWLLFIHATRQTRRRWRIVIYTCAAISGLLALCSREIACIWFALFLFHLFFFAGNFRFKFKVATLVGCLCLIGVYAGLRQLPPRRESAGPSSGWSNPMRAVLMLRALGDYGRLMIYPSNLHMERTLLDMENYQTNATWKRSVSSEYLSIAGLGMLAALLLGTSWRGTGRPARIFGASWFLFGYLPISNLFELNATVAEHWLYLPSVGFLIFAAGCVLDSPVRFRKLVVASASVAVIALAARSAVRSSDWVTEETFYRRTLAAGGMSTRLGTNLGQIYAVEGKYDKAEKIFRRMIEINPDFPLARNNLAEVLNRQGKKKEAEALFVSTTKGAQDARKSYPRTWIAVLNLAFWREKENNNAAAFEIAERARHDYPGVWEVIRFEAELLRKTKGPDAALPVVEDFARKNWWHYGAALALGRLYCEKGEGEKGAASLRHASWLDVHDVTALTLIAQMRIGQNRFQDAYEAQRRVISRQPDRPREYAMLSNILAKLGRNEEARAAIAEGLRLETLVQTPIAAN
jgi:tetratricopeptide (TPR) repeat protein